jgi:hypothetical protein
MVRFTIAYEWIFVPVVDVFFNENILDIMNKYFHLVNKRQVDCGVWLHLQTTFVVATNLD